MSRGDNWDRESRRTPSAIAVAQLEETHGFRVCYEHLVFFLILRCSQIVYFGQGKPSRSKIAQHRCGIAQRQIWRRRADPDQMNAVQQLAERLFQ